MDKESFDLVYFGHLWFEKNGYSKTWQYFFFPVGGGGSETRLNRFRNNGNP